MKKEIPKISFQSSKELDIEVLTFNEAYDKLVKVDNHNPFNTHKIQFYLILVVTKGYYSHYVDFQFYNLTEGSTLFIAKNQVHHFTDSMKNTEGFCIGLNSEFVEHNYFISDKVNLNRLYNYYIESPLINQDKMGEDSFIGIAKRIYHEFHFPDSALKSEMLRAMVHILLLKAERIKEIRPINGLKSNWLETFCAFKNLLPDEYMEHRNSKYYASKLLVSYKFLNDVVKALTNKTVKAFIDDYVILEIKRYLISTSLSVSEISYRTGFEEPTNMIQFFKKHTKMTPLNFRKKL